MTEKEIHDILQKVLDGEASLEELHKALDLVRARKLHEDHEEFPIGV